MNLWKSSTWHSLLPSYRMPQKFYVLLQFCLAELNIRAMFKSFLSLEKKYFSFIWLKISTLLIVLKHLLTSQISDFCTMEPSIVIVFFEGIFIYSHLKFSAIRTNNNQIIIIISFTKRSLLPQEKWLFMLQSCYPIPFLGWQLTYCNKHESKVNEWI